MTALSPGGHPAPEDLDDLLDDAGRADVAAHAEGCQECARLLEQLAAVRQRLRRARQEIALPAGLADQIHQALADEGRRRGARAVPTPSGVFDDSPPRFDVWPTPEQLPPLADTGTAAGTDGDKDTDGTVVPLGSARSGRRGRRPTLVLAAAASVAAIGLGGAIVTGQFSGGTSASSAVSADAGPAGMASDSQGLERSDFSAVQLTPENVDEVVRETRAGGPGALPAAPPPSALSTGPEASSPESTRPESTTGADACVTALALPGDTAAFTADWQGQPAYVLLPPTEQVYVVAADCTAPRVLHEAIVTR